MKFNSGDLLMMGTGGVGTLMKVLNWLETNQIIFIMLIPFLIGMYKSLRQAKLIEDQRATERMKQETERLKQEELKAEIDKLKNH